MTEKEFAAWSAETKLSRYQWREDTIYRLNGRGAMYYTGGEDGVYMRISMDGKLEAGHYEGAIPHIGEAMFRPEVTRQYDTYSQAFTAAMEAAGKQFLVDMLSQQQPAPEQSGQLTVPAAAENDMFYHNDDNKLCVGYLRGDFGRSGHGFHHSWFDSDNGRKTPEFKAEFQNVMDTLRLDILKDHETCERFCHSHPEARLSNGTDYYRYGFKLGTAERDYYIRCTALRGDYFYVFAYDKAPAPEKDLSAATVTHEDMVAYGYTWDGMEPMAKDEALGLWDSDKEVYLLYPDGTEAAADSRDDIAGFDGLFGRKISQRENVKTNAEKPSVLEQIREARKAPPAPRKQKDNRGKDRPEL